jgi:hypothetical protein
MTDEVDPQLVAHHWNVFSRTVLPRDVSPVQFVEMRKAFYAGVAYLLDDVIAIANSDDDDDTGARQLAAVREELESFARDLLRDYPTKGRM